ncbi:MAG: DUF1365 domain-containing protein [Hyphomicrobiaceae bacterium]
MSPLVSCIYAGTVVHKRLTPKQHGFAYRVFSLCLDVDEIDRLDRDLRLFSRNQRNVISFWDRDIGTSSGELVGDKTRRLLAAAGLARYGARIELVCYPRILGYVFNPLSVYFCRDPGGNLGVVIYEVTNTFGERRSYLVETAADAENGPTVVQSCAKELYVSPFTGADGTYSFHVVPPSERVVLGVAFRDSGRAVLKTHFRGERIPITDAAIAGMMLRYPLMTLKVISAIHFEAARLWAKGVPMVTRYGSPAYSFTIVRSPAQEAKHA